MLFLKTFKSSDDTSEVAAAVRPPNKDATPFNVEVILSSPSGAEGSPSAPELKVSFAQDIADSTKLVTALMSFLVAMSSTPSKASATFSPIILYSIPVGVAVGPIMLPSAMSEGQNIAMRLSMGSTTSFFAFHNPYCPIAKSNVSCIDMGSVPVHPCRFFHQVCVE